MALAWVLTLALALPLPTPTLSLGSSPSRPSTLLDRWVTFLLSMSRYALYNLWVT